MAARGFWQVVGTLALMAAGAGGEPVRPGDWVTLAFSQWVPRGTMQLEQRFEVTGEQTDQAGTRLVWFGMQVKGGISARMLVPAELFERDGVTQADFFEQTERLEWSPPGGQPRALKPEEAEGRLAGYFTFLSGNCRDPGPGLKVRGTERVPTGHDSVECLVIRAVRADSLGRAETTSWCSGQIPIAGFARVVSDWGSTRGSGLDSTMQDTGHVETKVLDFGRGATGRR